MKYSNFLWSFLIIVKSSESSKALEGYPEGYFSDCPGSNIPFHVPKKALDHIAITVNGPGNFLTAKRVKYSYYHMKDLAKDADINFSRPTMLYIGGYLIDNPGSPVSRVIGTRYKYFGYNALLLDLHRFNTYYYTRTVRYMKSIGTHIAEMIVNLTKEGLNPNTLQLVGLSLGAQTMSFIANAYRNITGTNLPLLIGIDPAGPCYRHAAPEDRLDPTDADFVMVIHANIDGYGMAAAMGHVDFYVNGGEYQFADVSWIPCEHLCSHVRAYWIWILAMEYSKSFIGIQCDSIQQARNRDCYDRKPQVTNVLSLKVDKNKQGIFYLSTSNQYPYYLGQKGLNKEDDYYYSILNVTNAKFPEFD